MMRVEVGREAEREFEDDAREYERQLPGRGLRFTGSRERRFEYDRPTSTCGSTLQDRLSQARGDRLSPRDFLSDIRPLLVGGRDLSRPSPAGRLDVPKARLN